jgi:hypothetical protein
MQKIQFYLVPNKITVTTDRTGFTTEFRKVYQRKLKIYKGIDNTVQLDVRNSEQRKQNVVGYTAEVTFFDAEHKELFSVTGTPIENQPGQIIVTIPEATIATVDPQQLMMAAKLLDSNDVPSMLYVDGNFELFGSVDLLNGYNSQFGGDIEEVTIFNYQYDSKEYVSEIAKFGNKINDDHSEDPENREITVAFTGAYQGIIQVEVTRDKSTAFGTTWTKLAAWDVVATPTRTYTGDYRFIRFRYGGDNRTGTGSGARFTVVRDGGEYIGVTVPLRGQNYSVGDQLVIPGSMLGGDDIANDLTITLLGINVSPPGAVNSTMISWAGQAVDGQAIYPSIAAQGDTLASTNPVDKIIIRN